MLKLIKQFTVHESQWQMTKGKKLVHMYMFSNLLQAYMRCSKKHSSDVNKSPFNSTSNDNVYFFETFSHFSLIYSKWEIKETRENLAKK